MNNLMPEKRFDRLGRLVTRWVKGDPTPAKQSILGTILPVIPDTTTQYLTETAATDKALREELLKGLQSALIEEADDQYELAAETGQFQEDPLTQHHIDSISRTMEKMDTETLQVLWDNPCDKSSLASYLYITSAETELREEIHYMVIDEENKPSTRFHRIMFAPIKKVLETDDLSTYPRGSTEHKAVFSVLQVLYQDWWRRGSKEENHFPDGKVEENYVRHLLNTLMDHPEKAARIKDFLIERNTFLEDIDLNLLDDYLSNPTQALGGGLL
jgi:hypothetical protein